MVLLSVLNTKLDSWKKALNDKDIKINKKKEYIACNLSKVRNEDEALIQIGGHEISQYGLFYYLKSFIQSNGEIYI